MGYPVTMELSDEPQFPDYILQANPFASVERGKRRRFDPLTSFWMCAAEVEADRVWWEILRKAGSEKSSTWLLRNPDSVGSSNIATISNLLRRMATDPGARMLPIYLPLPLAYQDLTAATVRTLADRIIPTEFRKCFYVFAADRVAEAIDDPKAAEELSKFDDLPELLEKLRNPKGSGVQAFLLPSRKTQVEERHLIQKPMTEEDADEEAKAELLARREEILQTWEKREQLKTFLERRLRDGDWGEGVRAAVRRVFETSAFAPAREPLADVADHTETLAGLLRFLRHRFAKVVLVVDQIEAFAALSDTEKARFLGALTEFQLIAADNAMWLCTGFPATVELIGEDRLATFEMVPFELSITREVRTQPIPPDIFRKIVQQFLETDPHRRESLPAMQQKKTDPLFPFDADCVDAVFEQEEGDCLRAALCLGKLVDAAKQEGLAAIDAAFAKAQIEKWRAEEKAAAEETAAEAEAAKKAASETSEEAS